MEEQEYTAPRPVNPRRRRRTKFDIFKEDYLPIVIIAVALALIITFIVGAVNRPDPEADAPITESEKDKAPTTATTLPTEPAQTPSRLQEVQTLIAQAEVYANDGDYIAAIALLNTFSGNISDFPELSSKLAEYESAQSQLVKWDDPNKVVHLSFQMLIADTKRAMNHSLSSGINQNYVTTGEFSAILQQLYTNGYVLVDFDDVFTTETVGNIVVYKANTFYLPAGKKPFMLTQNNLSYSYYLVDGDGDYLADTQGAGFAHKLLWDGQHFSSEMIDAAGNTVTGDFDLVPILEKFIASHPDFSFRGARANLALSAHTGLLGYRTHSSYSDSEGSVPSASSIFGMEAYQKECTEVKLVIEALKARGYTLSCNTYSNVKYGSMSATQIQNNLEYWNNFVAPLLGSTQMLTFARDSDIAEAGNYSGDKLNVLQNQGFRYYIGFCTDGQPWTVVTDSYVRQGRILVTGANMAYNSQWFDGMFDAASILDPARGTVPK